MKMKVLALVAIALSSTFIAPQALADEAKRLGRTIVFEKSSEDAVIPLLGCKNAKEIKIVAERDMTLQKAKFTFRNGESRTFSFYSSLDEDEQTKWRKFGYERCIKSIQIYGKAKDGRAGVKVYGKR